MNKNLLGNPELKRIARPWIERLKMQNVRIHIRWFDAAKDTSEETASATHGFSRWDMAHRVGSIVIMPEEISRERTDPDLFTYDMEQTILHELLHYYFNMCVPSELSDNWVEEWPIEVISHALINLDRARARANQFGSST